MTVCGVFQSPVVKVKLAGETVTSAVSAELKSITTFPVGMVSSSIVNVSVVPVSLTVEEPALSVIVNPTVSMSVTLTLTLSSGSAE